MGTIGNQNVTTPRTIGAYEIIREIGRGGMGIVYLAQDPVVDRRVALKMLPAELATDDDARRRFAQEVEVFARLEHPHIVPTYAVDMSGSAPLLAMRYLPGGTLRERIAAGSLSRPDLWRAVRQIARALDYAHLQGLVHRDVKPTNILFDDAGNAYISDFGIAKIINATSMLTMANMVTGTPAYMSPEQFRREDIDGRSDQYSLAIVLFEALAGRPPFAGDTLKLMYQHVYELPPSLQSFGGGLPAGLSASLERALAKQPESRHPSVEAFIDDAERQATAPAGKAAPPSPAPSPVPSPAPANREKAPSGRPETPVAAASPPVEKSATPAKKKADIDPRIVTGAGGQKEERRKMPRPLLAALILLPLLALGLFFLLRPTGGASQPATQVPAAVAEPTAPPTRTMTAEPEEPPATAAPAGGVTVMVDGTEITPRWTLAAGAPPAVVVNENDNMLIRFDDGSEVLLAPETTVALQLLDGEDGDLLEIELRSGRLLVTMEGNSAGGGRSIAVMNPIGAGARLQRGMMGVFGSLEPLRFEVDCLAGDGCDLAGDLDDTVLALQPGEAGRVGGSGRAESSGPAHFDLYALLSDRVPTPTATATPTATPKPSHTPRAVATAVPPTIVLPTAVPSTAVPPPPDTPTSPTAIPPSPTPAATSYVPPENRPPTAVPPTAVPPPTAPPTEPRPFTPYP